jgi:hypothetical protein
MLDALATPNVYAGILHGLAPFRVTLGDIKVQTAGPNPSDQLLMCLVPSLEAAVRYRLDRIEISSSSRVFSDNGLGGLIEAAITIAQGASPTFAMDSYGMALAVHGRVTGGTIDALIERHVPTVVPGTPALRPQGVTVGIDAVPPIIPGNVALERSLVVSGGVFLRVVTFQPGDIPAQEAYTKGMNLIRDVARRLDCELHWPQGG